MSPAPRVPVSPAVALPTPRVPLSLAVARPTGPIGTPTTARVARRTPWPPTLRATATLHLIAAIHRRERTRGREAIRQAPSRQTPCQPIRSSRPERIPTRCSSHVGSTAASVATKANAKSPVATVAEALSIGTAVATTCPHGRSIERSNLHDDGSASVHRVFPAQDIEEPLASLEGSLESPNQRSSRGEDHHARWSSLVACRAKLLADPKLSPERQNGTVSERRSRCFFGSCAGRI
jgi:hypothetical protein